MAQVGDEIYFHAGGKPTSGKIVCHGKHGATVKDDLGTHHKVKWEGVLGHKTRITPAMNVVDQGVDGAIVEDENGRRGYVHGFQPEAPEEPAPTQSKGFEMLGKALVLFAKAGPIKGKAGLHLEDRTDKTGRHSKRWVKGQEAAPAQRQAAKKEEPAAPKQPAQAEAVKPGQSVAFAVDGESKQGEVVAVGKDGATVKDANGEEHRVYHKELQPAKPAQPAKPGYAPRNDGENDKQYAKRVVDKGEAPESLPEEHDKYFETEGSTKVPISNLHSTKSDEENQQGGDNGPKRMQAAYHGALGKRAPITVMPHKDKDGHYEVVDGNGTLTSAKKLGWQHLPTKVVSREEGEHIKGEEKAKDIAKATANPESFKDLPKKSKQPISDPEELFRKAAETLDTLKTWLNRGKGLASQMGYQTMAKSPEDVTPEEWDKPGGMLFIAPNKGAKRSAEKVESDYGGDWSQLTDVVRCTMAVDDLHGMQEAIETLTKNGMTPAQVPKNKFLKPTPQGYMDMNFIVKMPDGVMAEIQFNVKDMLKAKNEAHHFYEETRSIEGKYAKQGIESASEWSDEDRTAYQAADAKQVQIYGDAWKSHVKKHYGGEKMAKSLCVLFWSEK